MLFSRLFERTKQQKHPPASEHPVLGRRYRKDIPYMFPKDAKEIERLDFQHYILRAMLKGNFVAPLQKESIHSMLDVGCGTGRWCREMADAFPNANVIGTDIESQLNPLVPLPANFRFVPNNLFDGLPFADGSFDVYHRGDWRKIGSLLKSIVKISRKERALRTFLSAGVFDRRA